MTIQDKTASKARFPVAGILRWGRWLLPLLALLLALLAASREFRQVDMAAVHAAFKQVSLFNTLLLIVVGLLVVSLNALYDVLLLRWLRIKANAVYVARYAWLASVLNNVAGFAGMTGAGVRYLGLGNAGVAARDAVAFAGLVLFSMPVGLSVLSTAVLVLHTDMLVKLAMPSSLAVGVLGLVSLYWVLFLLVAGGGVLHRRLLADTPPLAFPQRVGLLLVSLLDWLAVVLLLELCLWVVGVKLPLDVLLAAFTVAATLGWVSMVPGGLGVFEGTMLALLGGVVNDASLMLAALLLFRVVYYFIPFLFGVQMLSGLPLVKEGGGVDEFIQRFQAHPLLRLGQVPLRFLGQVSTQVLAYLTFAAGVVLLVSAAFPGMAIRLESLSPYVPLVLREGFHLSSVVAGALLLGLARGISAGMRGAYHTTQSVLLLGIVMTLLKGLDYEEALLLLVLATLLRANKAAFRHRGYPLISRRSLRWLVAGLLALLLAAGLGEMLYGSTQFTVRLGAFGHGADAARYARALIVMLLTFLAWLGWTWFSMPLPASMTLPERGLLERARRFYTEIGHTGYAYLSFLGDKYLFLTDQETALIQYGHKRNHLIALGDPAAADSAGVAEGIRAFRSMAEDYNRVAVFYQVDEANLHYYLNAGFALLKLGEKAQVPLEDFTLVGKKSQKLRTALNHGTRDGLSFEVVQHPLEEALWQELQAVSDAWLDDKQAAEKGFSLGRFERAFLEQCAGFALVKQHGRVVAFASVTPDFGQRDEYRIDLMRHLADTPNGTMDFLFVSLMQHAAQAGYAWFDLGVAPLAGVGDSVWSPREERLIRLVYQYGNHFYNFKGLRDYKNKFNPQWRSLYLAYPRRASLASILLDVAALVAGGYRQVLMK
ncbi:bifunctional lysylphosphatidylglycerol flippase/synthetase MprF [Thiothrix lacustris]|uniref:bifunctional lysylphosphatidylglycerol flippase/synthetase MprF n=1 Tax=Thiothrix lacustris TaxID=525917 RepID=UPI0027E40AB7|nr:bifunctional lysylphosphatidylglycerol flippase/synthetase MprF [Thiothrix lacustris]WMP17472.1 bifunctional lysylphosphatidylglycerol flippase/synthetase MprF [Thiothrix lacustris]